VKRNRARLLLSDTGVHRAWMGVDPWLATWDVVFDGKQHLTFTPKAS
jgi:hypothetical protein